MKIGFLMQQGVEIRRPPFNGPANHVREFIQELSRLGHQVRVLFRIEGQIWRTDNLEQFLAIDVPSVDRGFRRMVERGIRRVQSTFKLPYINYFESNRFAKACVQELQDCDVLYERLSWIGYGGGLAAQKLGIPLVLEDNGDHLADLEAKGIAPQGAQKWLSTALMKRSVRRASHVISTGEGWRVQFINRWDYDPHQISTVENGTALLDLIKREDIRAFNDKVPPTPLSMIYLGGFYPWHGVPVLLKAFALAHIQKPDCTLTLIGSGDGLEKAKTLVQDLGLSEVVNFTGQLRDHEFAPILADADIGLSPYCGWPEYSGLKIFDYKAAGMATITSGVDGQPRSVTPSKTGIIVPPCEPEPLADAILELANAPEETRAMGREARIQAENCHRWSHTVAKIEHILLNLSSG